MIVADMSGEGDQWLASFHFTAAANYQYIQTKSPNPDSQPLTLYRCPVT